VQEQSVADVTKLATKFIHFTPLLWRTTSYLR